MARLALALSAVLAVLGAPAAAGAQQPIHATSDAIYVGVRAEPGAAYLLAYDLDILVSDAETGISIGPSISVSFGGASSTDLGRLQEWLVTADFLRARATVARAGGFRLMALLGAGMYFVALEDQRTAPHLALLEDGTEVTVSEHHAWAFAPGAVITGGLGADWYWSDQWGISAYAVGHLRLDEQPRMPALWLEIGLGVRFGE